MICWLEIWGVLYVVFKSNRYETLTKWNSWVGSGQTSDSVRLKGVFVPMKISK